MQLVSVIIPYYNSEQWIEKTIISCIEQGEWLKEVIIVDDHSTDNGKNIILKLQKQYPNLIKYLINPEKGGNSARNYGFTKANGNYIQWLDADDILLPGKFERQLNHFKENPHIDIVYSDWQMDFYENQEIIRNEYRTQKQHSDFLKELLLNNWNPSHVYLMKRDIAKKTFNNKGWNVDTKVGQDREFYTKSAILNANFGYCKGNFAIYNRWSTNTVSHVSRKKSIIQTTLLNQIFYDMLIEQIKSPNKNYDKYFKLLNTELTRSLFYYPKLKLPRKVGVFTVNWPSIHWKIRPIVFFNLLLFK